MVTKNRQTNKNAATSTRKRRVASSKRSSATSATPKKRIARAEAADQPRRYRTFVAKELAAKNGLYCWGLPHFRPDAKLKVRFEKPGSMKLNAAVLLARVVLAVGCTSTPTSSRSQGPAADPPPKHEQTSTPVDAAASIASAAPPSKEHGMEKRAFEAIAVGMKAADVEALLRGIKVVKSGEVWTFAELPVVNLEVGRNYPAFRIKFRNGAVVEKQMVPGLDVAGPAPRNR